MKRFAILFFFCVTLVQAGTPVVNPTNYFEKWPWTNSIPTTWYIHETNTHCIYQLWYAIRDRAQACGIADAPAYERVFALSHGTKTNWTYTNWAQWGNSTTTNNYMTNYYPHLQLILQTNLWNIIEPMTNIYPRPDYAGTDIYTTNNLTNDLYYAPVISNMLRAMVDTVESICTNYLPQTASNLIKNLPVDEPLPRYHMAGLLTDAGCDDLVSNLVYDSSSTYVTNGNWAWRYTLPMSNMVYVKALDDLAAVVAQLEKSILIAKPCSPGIKITTSKLNGNLRDAAFATTNDSDVYFQDVGQWPYGWSATSLDTNWLTVLAIDGSDTTFNFPSNNYSGPPPMPDEIYPYLTNWIANVTASDWPSNGWRGTTTFKFPWTIIRTNETDFPYWIWVPFSEITAPASLSVSRRQLCTTNLATDAGTSTVTFSRGPSSNSGTFAFYSMSCTDLWQWADGYWEDGVYTIYNVTDTTNTPAALTNIPFNLIERLDKYEPVKTLVSTGRYTRHTNSTHSAPWTDSIAFTSRVFSNSWPMIESNHFELAYTNGATFGPSITNYFSKPTGASNYVEGTWSVTDWPTNWIACTGYFDVAWDTADNFAYGRAHITSFTPAGPNCWNGYTFDGVASLYLAGCVPSNHPTGKQDTWVSAEYEWSDTNYVFSFTNANEQKLTYNPDYYAVNTNVYTNAIPQTLPTDFKSIVLTNDNYPTGKTINVMLEDRMYWNARYDGSEYSWIPYEDTWTNAPRQFWGINKAFFLIQTQFPKRQ